MIEPIKLEDFKGMFWQDIAALVVTRLNETIEVVNKLNLDAPQIIEGTKSVKDPDNQQNNNYDIQ